MKLLGEDIVRPANELRSRIAPTWPRSPGSGRVGTGTTVSGTAVTGTAVTGTTVTGRAGSGATGIGTPDCVPRLPGPGDRTCGQPRRSPTVTVLVAGDDLVKGPVIDHALRLQGYDVLRAEGAREALDLASWEVPHLVLVHGTLARRADPELLGHLRAAMPGAVIVVLSGPCEESRVIELLDAGADDLIVGPVARKVLVARIRAHLRRRGLPGTLRPRPEPPDGDLRLDRPGRRASVGTAQIPLRPKELQVLAHLVARHGRVVSHADLVAEVWGGDPTVSAKAVNVQIYALRRKLHRLGPAAGTITTLRGHGYRYDTP